MDQTDKAVAEVLSLLLEQPVSAEDNISMEFNKSWDSIKHIEIIMTMEERFGVSFDAQDIPLLTSQAKLASRIRELLHA